MDKKITIQGFAELISEKDAELAPDEVETLLKAVFNEASLQLRNNGLTTIPGIGTFAKTSPEEGYISFEPDKELAEDVNSPFQAFSAVELDEEYDDEQFNEVDDDEASTDELLEKNEEFEVAAEAETVVDIPEIKEADVQPEFSDSDESTKVKAVTIEDDLNIVEETSIVDGEDVTVEVDDADKAEVVPPPVPVVEENAVIATPPPFILKEAYNVSSRYSIEPEEEVFVEDKNVSSGKRFANGLICGIVICIALAAIAAVVYSVYF